MALAVVKKLRCVTHKASFVSVATFCTIKSFNFTEIVTMTSTPLLYDSLDAILDTFHKPEHKDVNGVKELLEIYNNAYDQKNKFVAAGEIKKYPLIVLEGLDGSGKTSVGKRLSKKLDAEAWRTPPQSIGHLRHLFDDSAALRTAYYSLGNYIAALEVQLILSRKPVVMDRFWHSTAAYALAQAVQDHPDKYVMPPEGDVIYRWPKDLFKPDIVLLLEVNEKVRLQRHSRRQTYTEQENLLKSCTKFRQNVVRAYKNMYDPGVEVINNYTFRSALDQIEKKTIHLF